jgi:hypothetical protein
MVEAPQKYFWSDYLNIFSYQNIFVIFCKKLTFFRLIICDNHKHFIDV